MNEIDFIRKLAHAAGRTESPPVDVSARVLEALRSREDEAWAPLAWVAGFALAAALPVAVMAFHVLDGWSDPTLNVYYAFRWVML
ncbi:MAG: hypothetical protein AB1646_01095 [Thermodesulfobacteriota bacterium]